MWKRLDLQTTNCRTTRDAKRARAAKKVRSGRAQHTRHFFPRACLCVWGGSPSLTDFASVFGAESGRSMPPMQSRCPTRTDPAAPAAPCALVGVLRQRIGSHFIKLHATQVMCGAIIHRSAAPTAPLPQPADPPHQHPQVGAGMRTSRPPEKTCGTLLLMHTRACMCEALCDLPCGLKDVLNMMSTGKPQKGMLLPVNMHARRHALRQ